MERRLWIKVYHLLRRLDAQRPPSERLAGATHKDWVIAAVYYWAVLNGRTQHWCCQRENWPRLTQHLTKLPSPPTLSRRLRSEPVVSLLRRLEAELRRSYCRMGIDWVYTLDGKPLPVGGRSKDPDAARGRGPGMWIRGYRLHAVWGDGVFPIIWEVRPANDNEMPIAEGLLRQARRERRVCSCQRLQGGTRRRGNASYLASYLGYLLADAGYDSVRMYQRAEAVGCRLVAPRRDPSKAVDRRASHPLRLDAVQKYETEELRFGAGLHDWRTDVERQFSRLCSGLGGLQPLPAHVRRRHRVRRWVQAKLILRALATTL